MRKIIYSFFLLIFASAGLQAQISSFPHTEDFEGEIQCPTGCGPACALLGDWVNDATHDLNWSSDRGGTGSSNTGPTANGGADHTLGTSLGTYVYTESSCSGTGYPSKTSNLLSLYYDFTNASNPGIEFWYHLYGTSQGNMHIDVDTTKGQGAWTMDIVPTWTDNQDLWQQKVVSLVNYAGMDSVRIRIRMVSGTSFGSDAAVDDITVFQPSPYDFSMIGLMSPNGGCGLGMETVSLSYYSNGADTVMAGDTLVFCYQIDTMPVVCESFVDTNDILPGDTNSFTFTTLADLSNSGVYNVSIWVSYTQDSAYGNDSSLNNPVNSIPIVAGYPISITDFEDGANGWSPSAPGEWELGFGAKSTITGAASGVNAWHNNSLTAGYPANEDNYIESPCYDLSQYCDPRVRINIWWNSEFSWDGANLFASTDGGATWNQIGSNGDPFNWYNDNTINGNPGGSQEGWTGRNSTGNGSNGYVEADHDLASLAGQDVIFRINFGSDGSVQDDGFSFDNFVIYDGVYLGQDKLICDSGSVTLDALSIPGNTYMWSTGDTASSISVSTTGWYSVTVVSDTNCTNYDTVYVYVQQNNASVLGADTSLCGNNYMAEATYIPQSVYIWSTGDTTNTAEYNDITTMAHWTNVTSSGPLSVMVINMCDTLMDTMMVTLQGQPVVSLGPDAAYCNSVVLDAGSGGVSYMWSNGDSSATTMITSTGMYNVTCVDSNGCPGWDTIMVTINVSPSVDLGANQDLCDGASATLMSTGGSANSQYMWSTGDSTSSIVVSTGGSYSVICTDSNGCSGMDTTVVTMISVPSAAFTFAAGGNGLDYTFTDGSTNATTYAWDFGDGGSSTTASPTYSYSTEGSYTVTLIATNSCGSDTFSQSIVVTGLTADLQGSLSLYPNPNNGTFQVEMTDMNASDVNIEVVNLMGQIIYTRNLDLSGNSLNHQVEMANQASGMYYVRISSNGKFIVKNIIIK